MSINPVTSTLNEAFKGLEVTYKNAIDALKITDMNDAPIRRRSSESVVYKQNSTKTLSHYIVEFSGINQKNKVITKFIDPLNVIIMDSDMYIDIFKTQRFHDMILKYEYPVRIGGRITFIPVLFKIYQHTGALVKLSIADVDNLNKLAEIVWDFGRVLLSNVTAQRLKDEFTKAINSAGVICDILKIENPLSADVPMDDYIAAFRDEAESLAIMSSSGDDYVSPHCFDPKLAELLNHTLDINVKLNQEFMSQLANIVETVKSMQVKDSDKSKANLGDASQSSSSDVTLPAKKELVLELPSLALNFCYKENINEQPSFLFNRLTKDKFNETYKDSDVRILEIIPLLNVNKADVKPLDKDYLNKLTSMPLKDVEQIIDKISNLRGEKLLDGIITELKMPTLKVCGFERYMMFQAEHAFAMMIKTVVQERQRTPKTRIRNNFISMLFWSFSESRLAIERVGPLEFYSKREMIYLLNRACESLFFFDKQGKNNEIFVAHRVVKPKPVISVALGEKHNSLLQAASPKVVNTKVNIDKSIFSSNNSGAASKVAASSHGGDSGYRSVSSGDSFNKSSSYGDNCIVGQRSTKYVPTVPSPDIAQNIIGNTVAMVTTNRSNVYYENFEMKFSVWLSNPQVVRNQAKSVCKQDSFPRFYGRDIVVKNTRAVLTQAKPIDVMPLEVLDPVLQNNTPNVRMFSSMFMGSLRTTRAVAEKLTPSLLDHRERYNNSTLYCVGSMQMMMLADMEEEGFEPVFGQIPEGSFVTIEFNCENNQSNEVADATIRAMAEKRIFLNAKDLTAKDMQCAKLISAGPSAIRTHENNEVHHIGSSIQIVKCVRWAFYSDEPINVPNAIGRVTSANMQSFLSKVQMQCGDQDAYVSGFIQACCIINGKVHKEQYMGFPNSRFYMSTLEVVEINLPHANGHNFLWRIIRLEPARPNNSAFKNEVESLIGTAIGVLNRASVLIAGTVSLGISTFLNYVNITGFDLNSCVLPVQNANNLSRIMHELVTAVNGIAAPLFGIASGFISQFSSLTINPLVWNNRDWCNGLNSISSMLYDEESLWEGVWNTYIPYLIDPLAMAFIITSWPDVWGILAPNVTFELTTEINMLGPQELRMWDAFLGSKGYEDIGKSKEPFKCESYGIMVLNGLRQHFNVQNDWELTNQIYVQAGNRFYKVCNTDNFQPEYDEDFGIVRIGTLITYSWHLQRSIIPALTPANIGDGLFNILANAKFMEMTSAGIYLPNTQVGEVLATGIYTSSTIQGLGIYQIGTAGSSSARSEN